MKEILYGYNNKKLIKFLPINFILSKFYKLEIINYLKNNI